MILHLLTPVHSRDNVIRTRATLTACVKNNVNKKRHIGNLNIKRKTGLLTSTTVMRRMRDNKRIIAKRIDNDFCLEAFNMPLLIRKEREKL